MRVVQVSCFRDPLRRPADELLQAWQAIELQARAASSVGAEVTVVQAAWRDQEVARDGIRYRFVAEPSAVPPRIARVLPRRLAAAVAEAGPEVVHVQGLSFPAQTRLIARASGAPILAQDHADQPMAGWRRPLQRWGLGAARAVAFTVREQAAPFHAAGVLRPDVPVFEVLESSSAFTPGDGSAAEIDGDPCMLWVARLDENKDPLTVLEALSRLRHRLPSARLWMCYSDAPLEGAVRARLAAEPELAARVHLLGLVPHARVQELARAADLFVLGSRDEAMGYALVEALACGATPVVSDIPPFRRVTGGGAVGAVFPRGDAEALAAAILRISAGDRAAMRRVAREHFERHLSPAALGRELVAAYRGTLEAR